MASINEAFFFFFPFCFSSSSFRGEQGRIIQSILLQLLFLSSHLCLDLLTSLAESPLFSLPPSIHISISLYVSISLPACMEVSLSLCPCVDSCLLSPHRNQRESACIDIHMDDIYRKQVAVCFFFLPSNEEKKRSVAVRVGSSP